MVKEWMSNRILILNYANWIVIGLMAISLPTSKYTFSMFQFFLAGLFILDGIKYDELSKFFRQPNILVKGLLSIPFLVWISIRAIVFKVSQIPYKKAFFVFALFYLVHLIAVLYSENFSRALTELRVKLPMILIPLFFSSIKAGSEKWKDVILLLFVVATLIPTFFGVVHFIANPQADIRSLSPFIHHINFSVFVAFSIFVLMVHPFDHVSNTPGFAVYAKLAAAWLFLFLMLIIKSLTGVVVLFAGALTLFLFPELFRLTIRPLYSRVVAFLLLFGIIGYTGFSVFRYYNAIETVHIDTLEQETSMGNPYTHDLQEPMLENGHMVFIYIADEELKDAWNARSNYDYEGKDDRGHDLRYTLYRYITSMGLRKDAEGLDKLSDADIQHIERGLTNYIFASRYSLYPRIYQTIWEYDQFRETGKFYKKSFIQRLTSIQIGIEVARANPLFGVGTGDVVAAYRSKYHENYDLQLLEVPDTKLITGANQWLNLIVAFGLVGFLVTLFAFFYPAYISGAFQIPLFVLFFVVSATAMFGEEMLRFQTGLGFFAFFYSFFVFLKPANTGQQPNYP
jgi:hypothetical protein